MVTDMGSGDGEEGREEVEMGEAEGDDLVEVSGLEDGDFDEESLEVVEQGEAGCRGAGVELRLAGPEDIWYFSL